MESLVSVVIPAFNSEFFIRDCINSVLSQTYKNIEIIAIDDGSTDGTLSILNEYAQRVTVLKQKNLGAASARNLGLKQAKGTFIAFLDSDDIWVPEKLERQMSIMLTKNMDLVYCGGESFGQDGPPNLYLPFFSGNCYKYFLEYPTKAIVVLGCSSAVLRKSILDKSGYFDVDFNGAAEDWDFFRRYSMHGIIGYSNEILVKYRLHNNNITNRNLGDFYLGNLRAIKKMFVEDHTISIQRRAIILMKFELIVLKSAFKRRRTAIL